MEDDCPVSQEVIAAWKKGVKGDNERLSFKEFKAKARQGKAVVIADTPDVVGETQLSDEISYQQKITSQRNLGSSQLARFKPYPIVPTKVKKENSLVL